MRTLPERPQGAKITDLPWEPSPADRWAVLNLSDPPENGILPKNALVPDALAFALVAPTTQDPIEGIVEAVKIELSALADAMEVRSVAAMLALLARRLGVACMLLRYTDNRAPMPIERTEAPDVEALTPDSIDAEITDDAAPGGDS